MATPRQVNLWRLHKTICQDQLIPASTFQHMKLKGAVSTPSPTGNTEYVAPGPLTTYAAEVESTHAVWLVYQPFIRGEERGDNVQAGVMEVSLQEGQMPALDNSQAVLTVQEEDRIVTVDGIIFKMINPVISADQSWWTFLLEQLR